MTFKSYSSGKERAERIMKAFHDNIHDKRLEDAISQFIRCLANDFPQFRTAERPNEWEKGYHTVIETLHDIANEISGL